MKPVEQMTLEEVLWELFRITPEHAIWELTCTLDAAAKALPEGWWWERIRECPNPWRAGKKRTHPSEAVAVPDTSDETLDRYRLALAARRKEKTHER